MKQRALAAAAVVLLCASTTCRRPVEQQRDLQIICQKMIDLPELQQYYHADILPNRRPLVVAGPGGFPTDLRLTKFGQRVLIAEGPRPGEKDSPPILEFQRISIHGDSAHVVMHYAVEGVRVESRLQRRRDRWEVIESSLYEHGATGNP